MTKEKFTEILKEFKYTDEQVEKLWVARPKDDLDEGALRRTAAIIASIENAVKQE